MTVNKENNSPPIDSHQQTPTYHDYHHHESSFDQNQLVTTNNSNQAPPFNYSSPHISNHCHLSNSFKNQPIKFDQNSIQSSFSICQKLLEAGKKSGQFTKRLTRYYRYENMILNRSYMTIRSQLESHHHRRHHLDSNNNNLTDLDPMIDEEEFIEAYANSDDDDDDDEYSTDNSSISGSSSSNDESSKKSHPTAATTTTNTLLETSGQAGINAARRTWKSMAKMYKLQKKSKIESEELQRASQTIGWGINTLNNDTTSANNDHDNENNAENVHDDNDDDADADEQEINRYEQPIKTKYAKIEQLKKANRLKQKRR
ncbi:unnamed protein product [Schistosoma turkestanicum]|nr:unnamed protein product [Schistosoma turkestanicum]